MIDAALFDGVLDTLALCCVVLAAVFSLSAAVGVLRFTDTLSRLHAATKPQVFGLLLMIAAIALNDRSLITLLALLPVFVFQSLLSPVAAHMVARAAYRNEQIDPDTMVRDELGPAIDRSDSL